MAERINHEVIEQTRRETLFADGFITGRMSILEASGGDETEIMRLSLERERLRGRVEAFRFISGEGGLEMTPTQREISSLPKEEQNG